MPLTTAEGESTLWLAADILPGEIDSSGDKNHIFSVLFLKRLSDRFAEEVERVGVGGGPAVGHGRRSLGRGYGHGWRGVGGDRKRDHPVRDRAILGRQRQRIIIGGTVTSC